MQVFQDAGNPFQLDVPPVKNVNDVLSDPGIKLVMEKVGDHVIVNDTQLETLIPRALRSELEDLVMNVQGGATAEKDALPRLKEIEATIHSNLHAFNSTLAKFVHPHDMDNEKLDFDRVAELDATLDEVFKLDDHSFVWFTDRDTGTLAFSVLKLPDQNAFQSTWQGELQKLIEQDDIKPVPGTPAQQAAAIIVHEIEHAVHHQRTIENYFDKVDASIDKNGCKDIGFSLENNVMHARELESVLSEVNALKDTVPKELFEYQAAYYIAKFHGNHMVNANERHPVAVETPLRHNQYMTIGFQMHDYIQTGEIPDYAQSTMDVNQFFATTKSLYHDALQDAGLQPRDAPSTVSVTMSVVRQGLKDDAYTPQEAHVAQVFLTAMGDDLGIKAQDIDSVKMRIEEQSKLSSDGLNQDDSQPVTDGEPKPMKLK